MKRQKSAFDDPVVEEIRALRARIWKMSDGTVKGYLETLHREAERKAQKDAVLHAKSKPLKRRGALKGKVKARAASKRRTSRVNT